MFLNQNVLIDAGSYSYNNKYLNSSNHIKDWWILPNILYYSNSQSPQNILRLSFLGIYGVDYYLAKHLPLFEKQPCMSPSPFIDQIRDIAISEVVILLCHC